MNVFLANGCEWSATADFICTIILTGHDELFICKLLFWTGNFTDYSPGNNDMLYFHQKFNVCICCTFILKGVVFKLMFYLS